MTTNEHLVELERDLEADLLEARRELELGRDAAIGELDAHRDSLGILGGRAAEEILSIAREADEDLRLVQGRLGELNYILAEEEMDSLEMFDRYRDRILRALRDAKDDLSRLKARGREWSRHEKDIDGAWRQLSRRLDSVRKHLAGEADTAEREFGAERTQLVERLEEAASGADEPAPKVDITTRLREEYRQIIPAIKAMFVHPDETVPKTLEERRADDRTS